MDNKTLGLIRSTYNLCCEINASQHSGETVMLEDDSEKLDALIADLGVAFVSEHTRRILEHDDIRKVTDEETAAAHADFIEFLHEEQMAGTDVSEFAAYM